MKREDILANCIDEIMAGRCTLEDCLTRYPSLSDELRELLEIANLIPPEEAVPTPAFVQRARNRLLEVMEPPTAPIKRSEAGIFGWLRPLVSTKSLIIAVILFVLLVTSGGTVYAAQDSLPDDALYPVKTGVENMQLALTSSPDARAAFHLKLAQRRIEEVVTQSTLGRDISTSALLAVAAQIDAAIRELERLLPEDTKALLTQLSELTVDQQAALGQILESAPESVRPELEQAIDATRRGNTLARVAYGNPAVLSGSPSVSDEKLEASYFELEGIFLSIEDGTWNIGGILLRNVNAPQETPPVGSRIKIEGMVRGDQKLISELEHDDGEEAEVKIEGIFGGTSSDGEIWYVGEIPIGRPQNITPPTQGIWLKLKGIVQDDVFTVTEIESEEDKEGRGEIEGVLIQAYPDDNTIVVMVGGTQVTFIVSEALIMSDDRQPLTVSDLGMLTGEEIDVQGIYSKNSLLYAREIHVEVEQEQEEEEYKEDKELSEDERGQEGEEDQVEQQEESQEEDDD